jgi:hypothetical protein
VVRHGGKSRRTACFQESGRRYAQRLERVVSPVEFCFTTGKARSRWHAVNLLLQPQIAVATVTLTPPAYSRLAPKQFFIGSEPLAGLKQSRVELSVMSNRPLRDGELVVRPKDELGGERVVTGTKAGENSVRFEWTLDEPAEIAVSIRDLRGTRSGDTLRFEQNLTPDQPPEAVISEPAGFVLATADATVSFSGRAEDDLGLRRVELVRAVVGYRDRVKTLGLTGPDRTFRFEDRLDLKKIGAMPGQTLEFYLEASDLNPNAMGMTASEVARVQVISDDEYGTMLRVRTSVAEFLRRYQAIRKSINSLKVSLKNLQDAAEAKPENRAAVETALQAAKDAYDAATKFFERLAADFPAYDTEKDLQQTLPFFVETLRDHRKELEAIQPGAPGLTAMADEMRQLLGGKEATLEEKIGRAEQAALLGRVFECAAQFKAILRRQKEVVRRLDRLAETARVEDVKWLATLGRRQNEIREELVKLVSDLSERARALPETYAVLAGSALEFAERIEREEITELMRQVAAAAENHDAKKARAFAANAMEKLEQILKDCRETAFGGLCQGEMKFEVSEMLTATLEQMLTAILMQQGNDGEQGMDVGGDDDGYGTGGFSPLNIPVIGPDRMRFPDAGGAGGAGGGSDASCPAVPGVRPEASEKMSVEEKAGVSGRSLPPEAVPEKYRDAVKRYFGE